MNRRKALSLMATASVAGLIARETAAAELPMLTTDDPIAVALGYAEDAKQVDVAKYPKKAGAAGAAQNCANCALYKKAQSGVGTCSAIPGKWVKGAGWCNAWIPVG